MQVECRRLQRIDYAEGGGSEYLYWDPTDSTGNPFVFNVQSSQIDDKHVISASEEYRNWGREPHSTAMVQERRVYSQAGGGPGRLLRTENYSYGGVGTRSDGLFYENSAANRFYTSIQFSPGEFDLSPGKRVRYKFQQMQFDQHYVRDDRLVLEDDWPWDIKLIGQRDYDDINSDGVQDRLTLHQFAPRFLERTGTTVGYTSRDTEEEWAFSAADPRETTTWTYDWASEEADPDTLNYRAVTQVAPNGVRTITTYSAGYLDIPESPDWQEGDPPGPPPAYRPRLLVEEERHGPGGSLLSKKDLYYYTNLGATYFLGLESVRRYHSESSSSVESFTYSEPGQVDSVIDGNGFQTLYSYEAQGMRRQIVTTSGQDYDRGWAVDADPRFPTTVTQENDAGELLIWSFEYNHRGQVIAQTDPNGLYAEAAYDSTGRVLWIALPGDFDLYMAM
jgi:hypothetical protein